MAAESIATAAVIDDDPGQRKMLTRLLRKERIEVRAFDSAEAAAFTGEEADRVAADVGADAFLPSPVDGRQLIRKVRRLLENGRQSPGLRVLIVDDSNAAAGLLREAFRSHGYRADIALTARRAIGAFETTPYDAAVIDCHLPDRNGGELLDRLKTARPDCACIMITDDQKPELADRLMKKGASAFVRKPFLPGYLVDAGISSIPVAGICSRHSSGCRKTAAASGRNPSMSAKTGRLSTSR